MSSIAQKPAATLAPAIDAASKKEILRLILKYRAQQAPDAPTLARVTATANRFCRAGLGSPKRHLLMMKIIRDQFARLRVSRTDDRVDQGPKQVRLDLRKIAERYFGSAEHERSISNIMSFVQPYQAGVAHAADIAARLRSLRAIVQAVRRLAGPLQRLHWPRLQAEISPHLRTLSELEPIGSAPEFSPALATALITDNMLQSSIQARQLGRLDVLLDVLAGIHAVVIVDCEGDRSQLARLKRDVQAVARQLWELHLAMTQLDVRLLAGLLPPTIGGATQAPLAALADLLEGMATAAKAEVQTLLTPMGRPRVPDPLQLGVEQFGLLWRQVHSTVPATTSNRGGFGDLCITLLGPEGLGYAASEVRGKVRQIAHELAHSRPV